jgi:hypothetical protein
VYPSTLELASAQVALRGLVHLHPRENGFHFEVFFRFLNVGQVTWLPQDLSLRLPDETTKTVFPRTPGQLRFKPRGSSEVQLQGAVPPGQHDAAFRFEVPNPRLDSASFILSMPPRIAEMRVLADAARGMHLDVPGFPPASEAHGPRGQRLLTTQKVQRGTEPPLSVLTITLHNIPSSGAGRWVALALALIFASVGGTVAWSARQRDKRSRRRASARLRHARRILVNELVALERARQESRIGPRTHAATRQRLIDAVARIELLRQPRSSSGRRHPAGRSRPGQ